MALPLQPMTPTITLEKGVGRAATLYIDGKQAMQTWEADLMRESADLLCGFGSTFLEVGLGLGLSALRIASNPNTVRHVVLEKYAEVITLFESNLDMVPEPLCIMQADFVEYVHSLQPLSLDGIFFDPFLPKAMWQDQDLWKKTMPLFVKALRAGGAFIPCFSILPTLKWQFVDHFERAVVYRRSYCSYPNTEYTPARSGNAYIQCFVKEMQ